MTGHKYERTPVSPAWLVEEPRREATQDCALKATQTPAKMEREMASRPTRI